MAVQRTAWVIVLCDWVQGVQIAQWQLLGRDLFYADDKAKAINNI